ncbi:MAG: hypothetical protein K8I27_01335 [Planctomycetes bacterium]|nr:hypothetical protein [Planctomycetota bacterium]
MIKLHASYGLKVPGPQEYSSESFHASAEVEVADNIQGDALKAALGALWNDLKSAVDEQIANGHKSGGNGHNGNGRNGSNAKRQTRQTAEPTNRIANMGEPATKKQVSYLLALARRKRNLSAEETRDWLNRERGLVLSSLSKSDAAGLIDEFNETRN